MVEIIIDSKSEMDIRSWTGKDKARLKIWNNFEVINDDSIAMVLEMPLEKFEELSEYLSKRLVARKKINELGLKAGQEFKCTNCDGKVRLEKNNLKKFPLLFCPYCDLNCLKVVKQI